MNMSITDYLVHSFNVVKLVESLWKVEFKMFHVQIVSFVWAPGTSWKFYHTWAQNIETWYLNYPYPLILLFLWHHEYNYVLGKTLNMHSYPKPKAYIY